MFGAVVRVWVIITIGVGLGIGSFSVNNNNNNCACFGRFGTDLKYVRMVILHAHAP
jgi:hypothetical protein